MERVLRLEALQKVRIFIPLQRGGEDHAGGGSSIRQNALDEFFELA